MRDSVFRANMCVRHASCRATSRGSQGRGNVRQKRGLLNDVDSNYRLRYFRRRLDYVGAYASAVVCRGGRDFE